MIGQSRSTAAVCKCCFRFVGQRLEHVTIEFKAGLCVGKRYMSHTEAQAHMTKARLNTNVHSRAQALKAVKVSKSSRVSGIPEAPGYSTLLTCKVTRQKTVPAIQKERYRRINTQCSCSSTRPKNSLRRNPVFANNYWACKISLKDKSTRSLCSDVSATSLHIKCT